jgi:hypothetical protein
MLGIALLFLILVLPGGGGAQSVSIAPMLSSVRHDFLTDRAGALGNVDFPVHQRVSFRLQIEGSRGRAEHPGVLCFGPMDPNDPCAEESIRDRSSVMAISIAAPIHVMKRPMATVSLIPLWIRAATRLSMTGSASGRQVTSRRTLSGPGIGVEVSLRPSAALRSAFVLGARYARPEPPTTLYLDVDRVEPLRQGFSEAVFYLGARFGR